jgi:hypothetical protein
VETGEIIFKRQSSNFLFRGLITIEEGGFSAFIIKSISQMTDIEQRLLFIGGKRERNRRDYGKFVKKQYLGE